MVLQYKSVLIEVWVSYTAMSDQAESTKMFIPQLFKQYFNTIKM